MTQSKRIPITLDAETLKRAEQIMKQRNIKTYTLFVNRLINDYFVKNNT